MQRRAKFADIPFVVSYLQTRLDLLRRSQNPDGGWGYFPTYTLGSLYAAQLVESYDRSHRLDDEIRCGDFAGLRGWLRKNLHLKGNGASAEALVAEATGRGLEAAAFFRHLEKISRT